MKIPTGLLKERHLAELRRIDTKKKELTEARSALKRKFKQQLRNIKHSERMMTRNEATTKLMREQ